MKCDQKWIVKLHIKHKQLNTIIDFDKVVISRQTSLSEVAIFLHESGSFPHSQ